MAQNRSYKYGEDVGYVDIHGHDIKILICEKTGRILVPINELKESGFQIYRKSQYNKLLIDDSQFTHEFDMFMLQCAQTYMLRNKIVFKENEILESINKCKKLLKEGIASEKKENTPSIKFLENSVIEKRTDENISITTPLKEPCTVTVQNLNLHNVTNKRSPNTRFFDQAGEHNDELKKLNGSFEYKNFKASRSFDQSSVHSDDSRNSQRHTGSVKRNIDFDNKNQNNSNDLQKNGFTLRKPANFNENLKSPPTHTNQQRSESESHEEKTIARIELVKPEYDVVVTFVENKYTIWVQDLANSQTLLDIDEKVKEEAKTQRGVSRCEYNSVYLAPHDGLWYRCKPIKFKPLIVFFLDYGNSTLVNQSDLREISERLASIPAQSVKIVFEEQQYKPVLFDQIRIKVVKRFERGTYKVDVIRKCTESIPVSPPSSKITIGTYFDKPKPLCELRSGQRVMIINEVGGKLALRTKECYDKLKQIEQALEGAAAEPVEKIEKKQLVLCARDDRLMRGQVIKKEKDLVEVELLDYCEKLQIDASQIKHITDVLSLEPVTYLMTPMIKGFKKLSDKGRNFIKQLIDTRAKSAVIFEGSLFDLKLIDDLLSNKLKNLEESSDKVMLSDFQRCKPSLGPGRYMLYAFQDINNVTVVSGDDLEKYMEDIIITEMEDSEPYTPILGEVCFGLYEGSWSRCLITKVHTSRFEVQFVDFGNCEFLNSEQLRKLSKNVAKSPIVGIPCKFVELPLLEDIHELLKQNITDGEWYDLVIKRFESRTDRYEIEAPELYKKLKENN